MATEEKRPIRRLSSFDYLLGIDDSSRMGGFRFKETPDGDFINSSNTLHIPPLTCIYLQTIQNIVVDIVDIIIKQKASTWKTAIGLQAADGLQVSGRFIHLERATLVLRQSLL